MSSHKVGKLVARTCALFLCDMQEKFRQSVVYFPQIVSVAARMLEGARALEIPTIVTEQYPQGLGPTVPELGAQDLRKISKTCFSMLCPEVERELDALPGLQSVLLCGIETQACIMSTALDLLEKGLDVHVIADACSSRSQVDRLLALSRMRQSGAFITTSEAALLQLLSGAKHPKFREVQKIIMEPAPDSNLIGLFRDGVMPFG
ncbi:isochorismatase domain-containing protein 2 isoform X1 [Mobula hypostoma]|uniref:isochorismatase domain-containing protein 2 isoform X1 n=1 Tax=Mobula hypostoma TaxID=723540 RepID=UPI002FC2D4AD